jgi:hypothetical protein
MDAAALKLLGGLALCAAGLAGLWRLRRRPSPPVQAPVPRLPEARDADRLLAPYRGRLRAIQERSRFSAQSFERDVLTLVRRMLAHPHYNALAEKASAPPPADIRDALDLAHQALGIRQALLLPPGAPAEDIEPRSFRWTYGVLLSALLWELRWSAAWTAPANAGLRDTLHPWLEAHTLQWLFEDEQLVQELTLFFAAPDGRTVFHQLVANARRALGRGPEPAPATVELPPAPAPIEPAPALTIESPAPPAATPEATPADPPLTGAALARSFMAWLAQGLASHTIASNTAGAQVHFVAEGMVLVAPGIFQSYAASGGGAQGIDIPAAGKAVQKAVCEEGWHLRGPQNAHLHRFAFGTGSADGRPAVLKGLVIQAPQRFLAALPAPNPALSRLM